ncbi:MAG: MMPL family transporter [Deltaproteobacteria bacterium]|nr:MMPL family transporter [Deltaproteobacteria bacterium]
MRAAVAVQTIAALIERRAAVIAVVLALTGAAALSLCRIHFEDRIDVWFVAGDAELAAYREFKAKFESDELIVVGVSAASLFTPEALAALERLTREVAHAPHVRRALSLTNVEVPMAGEDGLEVRRFIDSPPYEPAAALRLRTRALAHPLIRGNLVSADGRAAAILVELAADAADVRAKRALVDALRRLGSAAPPLQVHVAGLPVLNAAFHAYSQRDLLLLVPLSLVLVGVAVFLLFRRFFAVLITLAVVFVTLLWVFGLVALCGIKVHVLLTALPTFLLVASVGDAIHLVSDYEGALRRGAAQLDAVRDTVRRLVKPCFFTAATTAVGALALGTSDLGPVRDFAWLGAAGVMIGWLLTMTFAPALLAVLPVPRLPPETASGRGLRRLLAALALPTRRQSVVVLAATVVLAGVAAWGTTRLHVGTNALTYFRDRDPVRVDTEFIDATLGGTGRVELVAHAPQGGLKHLTVLRRLEALAAWVKQHEAVTQTFSVVDVLKALNWAAHGEDPDEIRLPESRLAVVSYYAAIGAAALQSLVQDDFSVGRLSARLKLTEGEALARQVPVLEAKLAEAYADQELTVHATGIVKLMGKMEKYILESQTRGFATAFVLVALLLLALLRSVRLTLLVMIPNALPVLFAVGFMGIAGIPLDPATAMVAPLSLGLIDDDTVHFVVRMREHQHAGLSLTEALARTVQEVGRPMLMMSAVLALGFGVLLLASFAPNVHFAAVTLVVISLAVLGDLVLLPAVLTLARPWFRVAADVPPGSRPRG